MNAGETICLRQGTYTNASGWSINSSVDGTSGSPITFRNYPGERATLDTASGTNVNNLTINGDYVRVIGLEITNSSSSPANLDNGQGVSATGTGIKVINCIIHDSTGNGIGVYEPAIDFEAYGNVIYYNGKTPNDGNNYAYALYVQNTGTFTKDFKANALLHNYGPYIVHAYTQGAHLDNLRFYNNASANYTSGGSVWLIGGGDRADNPVIQDNYLYANASRSLDLGGYAGYAGTNNASVTGNWMGGSFNTFAMSTNNVGTNYSNNHIYYDSLINLLKRYRL